MLMPQGIIPALITPFTPEQELDEAGLRLLARRLIDAGVHGLFCLGTNGEFFSLTFDEKVKIAEIVLDEAAGRVPVYVGAGAVGTEETKRLAVRLERAGVDALTVIAPYFLSFTQKELADHFRRVADATALPVLLYNIPSNTGNALQPETVSALARVPNIVGIKDSSGSFDTILRFLESADDQFSVLAGTDSLILPTLMAGGKGAVAATANLLPRVVVDIYEKWKQAKYAEAEMAQRQLRALRSMFKLGTLPSVLKEAMSMAGLPAGPARWPVGPITDEAREILISVVNEYKMLQLLEPGQPLRL